MDQEADDETKDWLDNMMSNSVSAKKGQGMAAASQLREAHKSLQRRELADSRAMRKTLILKTATADMDEARPCLITHTRSVPCRAAQAWHLMPTE